MMIIFDLDQTLIDSSTAEPLRKKRKWGQVYSLIPLLKPYPGINALMSELHSQGITLGIVTSSPRIYCTKVVDQWGWPISNIVAYHDTAKHKPDPEPILMAIQKAGNVKEDHFYVGDMAADTHAAKAAGVTSLGALWGSSNPEGLRQSAPDFLFSTVAELNDFLLMSCISSDLI
jgi:phosphoglycolate phosphatase-like HAD superfamily hydrolase